MCTYPVDADMEDGGTEGGTVDNLLAQHHIICFPFHMHLIHSHH